MSDFRVTHLDQGVDFANLPYWDVIIIGAGPAGLAAGLTTAHRALTTLVIEAKDRAGGQPQFLYAFKEITSPYWLNEKRLRDQKIALIGDKIAQAARK